MNKNIVLAIARRDLRSWFSNPTGYIFIALFVAACCVALMWSTGFFQNGLANLDTLNFWFPAIAILFVAASTMNMWASERANGTQELLFTLPARDFDVLCGKFLAAVGVYTLSLLFTFPLPLTLSILGEPDWGQLFANYAGFWLFGTMLVSVSMLGSQLTQNAAVAFILNAKLGALVTFVGWVLSLLFGSNSWHQNGPFSQFQEFARGMLPMSGILLFLGLTVAFFYLSLSLLARRHWRSGEPGLHAALRFLGLGVGTAALTVIAVNALPRFDATVEGIHSLGAESKKLLASLDRNRPVIVTAYVSEDVPPNFVQQKRTLLNLLDQFDSIGGSAVERRVEFVTPYSPQARDAEKNYGIRPQLATSEQAGGGVTESQLFLGFVAQCGTEEVVVPFIEPALPLEFELTRAIRVVANAGRRKVGMLKTDVELGGGFDFQTFKQKPRWQIADELQQQYKVENVDPDQDYPAIDCLVVPQPSSLTPEQMRRLQDWIAAGNPTLLLEDPAPLDAWGTAIDDPKGGQKQNMMFGGPQPGQKGDFAALLASAGLSMPRGEVVWDTSSRSFPGGRLPEEFVFVRGPGIAQDSAITRGLQSVVVLLGGHLRDQKKDGFTVTPLLTSPDPVRVEGINGIVQKLNLFQFDPFGGGPVINPYRERERRNQELVIAARVAGKPAEGRDKGVNLICIADLDLVGNQFFMIRRQLADPNLRFDNVTFVMNCIDTLVGDDSLIELRKRRPVLRKLTKVEEAQRDFERDWALSKEEAEKAAKAELDKAQKRLDDAVAQIRDAKDLDEIDKERRIVTVQSAEQRKLDMAKARIEDDKRAQIEMAAHKRDEARRGIHNRYRILTLVLAVLPALGVGIATFLRRRSREASIVPKNRMVTGGVK